MSSATTSLPTVEAIERACARAETIDEVFEVASYELSRTIPHDGSMWFGVDPATLLAVFPARFDAMDPGYCSSFWHNEFHEHDANLFSDMARRGLRAASLRLATDGQPLRSRRYRDFLRPQGYDDELRGLFQTGPTTWAVTGLYRERGRAPFTAADAARLDAISETVGCAYRLRATLAAVDNGFESAPGLLLFDEHDSLISTNESAREWLREIYDPCADPGRDWIAALSDLTKHDLEAPFGIVPVVAHARAVAAGIEHRPARLRLRGRSGRWVLVHGTCLHGQGQGASVAVVIEPARNADIAPIIIEAYGLTAREREVVRGIARATPTPELAAQLFLSVHTVRDHVKSIFEKVGVSSRGELVAKLFAEHYVDDLHAGAVHVN